MNNTQLPADGIVRTLLTVKPEWLDYNDHVNVAYYVVAFEHGIEDLKATYGLDASYRQEHQRSTVALEVHLTYQNEARRGDDLRIESRILGTDGKRLHLCQAMYRETTLLTTQEVISISFDLMARRTCPFAPELLVKIEALQVAQAKHSPPSWVGRSISLEAKKP